MLRSLHVLIRYVALPCTLAATVAVCVGGCASEVPEAASTDEAEIAVATGDGAEFIPVAGNTVDVCNAAASFDRALRDLLEAVAKLDAAIAAETDPAKKACLERLRASVVAQWTDLKRRLEERFGPGLGNMTYCLQCEFLIGSFPLVGPLVCKASLNQPTKVLSDAVAELTKLRQDIIGGIASCTK